MHENLTDLHLLRELEPVVEKNLNRHLSMRKDWNPHDYIPWSDGKNYYALGGQDWDPDQSKLNEVAQVAMVQNLLTAVGARPASRVPTSRCRRPPTRRPCRSHCCPSASQHSATSPTWSGQREWTWPTRRASRPSPRPRN